MELMHTQLENLIPFEQTLSDTSEAGLSTLVTSVASQRLLRSDFTSLQKLLEIALQELQEALSQLLLPAAHQQHQVAATKRLSNCLTRSPGLAADDCC